MPYITEKGLLGLRQYQYKSGGYTWLDDLHQPFWNGLTEMMPRWVAPNLITMVGTIGLLLAYILFLIEIPTMEGDAPRWVFLCGGFAVFAYLHLDCIDGKQARRTKSSSPLGQLFDHGCDALSVHLILANLAASLGMGLGWKSMLFQSGVMGPWALAHWEEYHSGMMLYGTGYWGVTEANYLVVGGHLVSAIFGARFWGGSYEKLLGWRFPFGIKLRRGDINLLVTVYGGIHQSFGCILRTLKGKDIKLPVSERGHKQLGKQNAVLHLLQLNVLFIVGSLSTLEASSDVWHTRLLMANYGIVFAFEMSQLILSHMAKQPFRLSNWPLLCLLATLLNGQLRLVPALPLAAGVNLLLLAAYLHYVISTVRQICAYLSISCFTIPYLPEAQNG